MDLLGQTPAWWMGLLALANLVVLIGAIALGWMNLRMRADFVSKTDYVKDKAVVDGRLDRFSHRLGEADLRLASIPRSDAIHELSIAIEELKGELKVSNERLNGVDDLVGILRRQIELIDEYLRKLGAKR